MQIISSRKTAGQRLQEQPLAPNLASQLDPARFRLLRSWGVTYPAAASPGLTRSRSSFDGLK